MAGLPLPGEVFQKSTLQRDVDIFCVPRSLAALPHIGRAMKYPGQDHIRGG